jgi:uncharacterized protein YhaN
LDQINNNINAFLTSGAASKGLRASNQLKAERDQIQKQIDANNQEINGLSDKLVPLKTQASEVQAKLGPIKYVAALFGFQDPEVAVRILILLIMVAFDPLAICLIIAASVAYDDYKDRKAGLETEVEETFLPEPDPDINPNPPVEFEEEDVTDPVITADEEARIAELNAQLLAEVESFKADLAEAQDELEREKMLLEAARSAHEEDVRGLEVDRGELAQAAEVTAQQAEALATLEAHLKTRDDELNAREAELADRIALLEKFFPAGTTDDQAIIALLEKNPKILEDIVEIVETSKKKDEGSGPTMVIRT